MVYFCVLVRCVCVCVCVHGAYFSNPSLTSLTLLGLQHTAVVTREGSKIFEKYNSPTRFKSSMLTAETAVSSFLQ